jgi:hypothetical protein
MDTEVAGAGATLKELVATCVEWNKDSKTILAQWLQAHDAASVLGELKATDAWLSFVRGHIQGRWTTATTCVD